ncbi:MAG: hypothetical protein HWQ41_03185 [Nostoc sp. NOS(2021)]|uniref:hypothetical protein n=1 Tax=Nostoc sp. NOS(2021) TaxID=2815407 RepID=UPI0025F1B65A|nr:hypothetical protein [Nostoc sp. NOS(2021)]MBN3894297.1 hypothetical protein [Nostoc sp. NOS(2021)]
MITGNQARCLRTSPLVFVLSSYLNAIACIVNAIACIVNAIAYIVNAIAYIVNAIACIVNPLFFYLTLSIVSLKPERSQFITLVVCQV